MSARLQAPKRRSRARVVPERPRPVGGWKTVTVRLAGGAAVLYGVISLIGLFLTHVVTTGWVHSIDRGVDVWFAQHRTGTWNDVTAVGTELAQTETAIAVTVVMMLVLRWRLGRWYESWVIATAMVGELLVFLAVTATVHRPRPQVARLDAAPPTSSFPSGHTAAALALYGSIAILVLWVYGRRRAPQIAAGLLLCIPVVVGLCRLYRGMHYPTDVLSGALTGGLWLLLVITTLLPRLGTGKRRAAHPAAS